MSSIAFSYRSLNDASNEAGRVARKFDAYADSIQGSVVNKLNQYDGQFSTNLSNAKSNANSKIRYLRNRSNCFDAYSYNLSALSEKGLQTDKAVRSGISTLTAQFKDKYSIRNSQAENAISYFTASMSGNSNVGRWIDEKRSQYQNKRDYLKQSIEDWYDYEGGKDYLINGAIAAFEVVAGICAVAAAIAALVAGGGLFAMIAAVASLIGGVIALSNGIVNLINEGRALNATDDDPALAKRLSDENSMQDCLRDGNIVDNTQYLGTATAGANVATGIDVVNFVCTAITLADGIKDLVTKGFKVVTGEALTKDNLFKQDSWKNFGQGIKEGASDLVSSLKGGDGVKMLRHFGQDFKSNLIKQFSDFSTNEKAFKSLGTFSKTCANTIKVVFTGDGKSLWKLGQIALTSITIGGTGDSRISLNDFVGDQVDTVIDAIELQDKFSSPSDWSVGIADNYVPKINIPSFSTI